MPLRFLLLFILSIAAFQASAAGALVASTRDKTGAFVYGACANQPSVTAATSCAMTLCRSKASKQKTCKVEAIFGAGRTLAIVPTKGGRATVQLADSVDEAVSEAIDGCKEEFEDSGVDVCLIERTEVFAEAAEKPAEPELNQVKHAELGASLFFPVTSDDR